MSKKILLGLILGSSILFIVISTYLWYHFFTNSQNKTIILNTQGDTIIVNNNNTIDKPIKYNMEVKNYNGNKNYYLYIVDDINNKKKVDKKNISFQLILNGSIIKEDKLENINNYLDQRFINSNLSNNYELVLWVNQTSNLLSYKCQIKLMKIE